MIQSKTLYITTIIFLSHLFVLDSQADNQWSHWTIVDDLVETWSLHISTNAIGEAWITHSDDGIVSVLDGYSIHHENCPPGIRNIKFSLQGDQWTFSSNTLHSRIKGTWEHFDIPFTPEDWFDYIPISSTTALITNATSLYLLNSSHPGLLPLIDRDESGIGPFTGLTQQQNGMFWITGKNGVASFQFTNSIQNWTEIPTDGLPYSNFQSPWISQDNELYLIAQNKEKNIHQAVVFAQDEWRILQDAYGLGFMQCWKSTDGVEWILNRNNTLIEVQGNSLSRITRRHSSFGQILALHVESNGIFWLATSKGVFRYTPPLWNIPDEISDIQNSVNSVVQDNNGNLWFDCTTFLLQLNDEQWKRFPYPNGRQSNFYENETLCVLPNQSIAIRMLNSESVLHTFHPETESFETIDNPYQLSFGKMQPMDDGTIWFQLGGSFYDFNSMTYQISAYDGERFTTILDMEDQWGIAYPRSFLNNRFGIWAGGSSGLGLYQDSSYTLVNTTDKIEDEAAFALYQFDPNTIWVGGRNNIRSYDGTTWKIILEDTDQIRSFYRSNDNKIWVCTASGLTRYQNGSWFTMTEQDGLPSNVVNEVLIDQKGITWAATSNGIAVYQPGMDTDIPITDFKTSQNSESFAPNSIVRIEMQGIDKWKSQANSTLYFSYRINDNEWSPYQEDNMALFQNLDSGTYIFEYRVMDRNNNVSQKSPHFEFTVLNHWYNEPTAIIIIVLFFGITVFCILYAIKYHLRIQFINNQLQTANEELERISCIDGLTGINNRRSFDEYFSQEWRRALRTKSTISIMICDVDFFKLYNDHYGHLAGDDCLRVVAKTLASSIQRAGDMVARYGGEEFVVLLVNTSFRSAELVASRIHQNIEKLQLPHETSKCKPTLTISGGVASAIPENNYSEKTLLAAADKALYLAKQSGRNQFKSIENPFEETIVTDQDN